MEIKYLLVIALAIAVCIAAYVIAKMYVKKMFKVIDDILSAILAKKPPQNISVANESLESKLVHKAIQIIRVTSEDLVRIQQEKQAIQIFITDMSHQMKTPLAGVSMYTDILIEGNVTQNEQAEFLSRIKIGSDKIQWMMESLIKISRLEVGAIVIRPEPNLLMQTITDAINLVYAVASKKNITLVTTEFKDIAVMHDRKWTAEAFANILENAVKYSSCESEVNISIEQLPIYTRIDITNLGVGIDKSEWGMIFKRFYRGKNSVGVDGTGVGLYLVSIILQNQGGYVLVSSTNASHNKHKTCFSVFLQNCKN